MSQDIILETRKLTKEFKGFVAVSEVDLKVERGSIHALIGPNGAGKTTCFNLLTKFLTPTSGRILFKGTGFYRTDSRGTQGVTASGAPSSSDSGSGSSSGGSSSDSGTASKKAGRLAAAAWPCSRCWRTRAVLLSA